MFLRKLQNLPVPRLARFTAVVAVAMAAGHLAQTMAAHQMVAVPVAAQQTLPTHIVQLSSGGATTSWVAPSVPVAETSVPDCPMNLQLKTLPQAMLSVALTAPCHGGERVVLHHAGLAVTSRIGADGKLSATLPALTTDGAVAVQFANGARVTEAVAVPEAAGFRRFGVQWQGAAGFMLHGMENGAEFGQAGDVSQQNPVGAGFLTVLGDATVDNPLLAQVYTYPVGALPPEIVLEAAVLPATCGHDLLGDVLTSQAGQALKTDLTVAMPDCSGVGDFLVLKNLASDLKIAAN